MVMMGADESDDECETILIHSRMTDLTFAHERDPERFGHHLGGAVGVSV